MTICNLNRLNTPASRERHNQPGRGSEEINSQTLCLSSLCFSVFSRYLLVHLVLTFSYRLNALFFNFSALTPFSLFSILTALFLISDPFFSSSLQHTDILLGRDFHYLRSGTIYQGMGFCHLLWLTGGLSLYWMFSHPLFSPLQAQIRLMTSLSRCSHSCPCSSAGIHNPLASSVLS